MADDPNYSGDDVMSITHYNPSSRSTDQIIELLEPYNIDDYTAKFLYDGSIIQKGGDEIYDGIVNFGAQGIYIEIMQNGQLIADNFWTDGISPDPAAGISHRFILKVRTNGQDIDGRRLIGLAREYGYTYSEFTINGTSRGVNVLALTHAVDLNNQTPADTVKDWNTITNTEGFQNIDVDNDGNPNYFFAKWDRDVYTINQLYERIKWLCRRGSTEKMYGLDGKIFRGITHEIPLDNPNGTFKDVEAVSWSTGTGQMLAINDTSNPTKMWIQLLTGTPPLDNDTITGADSGATADVNGSYIERTVVLGGTAPMQSTGSAMIGAYGFGVEFSDLTAADKMKDLDGNTVVAPNYATFTVTGLVANEDRVLVAPAKNGQIDVEQLEVKDDVNDSKTVVMTAPIPEDTPATGTLRLNDGKGYVMYPYESWSGDTFTLVDKATIPAGTKGYIGYIDALYDGTSATNSYTAVQNQNRDLFVRVRDGGATPIKQFESVATQTPSGGTIAVIRTSDQ